ncbi:MAG: ornithine carbamoyltransferase [Candidatus Nanohaloarchaea archaeon]|nr:ornithine carbamoyltransferase [Candidatus Nanohaloarchaea archaeon]
MMMDDVLDIDDLSMEDVERVYSKTTELKREPERFENALANRTLLMLFEKPSTRTRISFEAGMTRLGGHAINFTMEQSQMSRGESLRDTARVIGRYCDAVMARLYEHQKLLDIAENTDVPVINGLTDLLHPCQALGDLYTMQEHGIDLEDARVVFVGDGNNVCHSLMQATTLMDGSFAAATPEGYEPDERIVERSREKGQVDLYNDPVKAVEEADVVYTDVWVSMGDEDEDERREAFPPFQVNEELLSHAPDHVKAMHCLPAHRGEEITDAVMEGKHSIIFDQAENRMHVQNGVLLDLLTDL